MGASQSRGSKKQAGKQNNQSKNGENSPGLRDVPGGGYFIFSFKDSKIKIVNIHSSQQKMITVIIKRHCRVSKEGWEHGRSMTYFFKIDKIEKYELIRLVTDLLLSLYREGWEPMTPIDTAIDKADKQTSICWRRREDNILNCRGSSLSLASVGTRGSCGTYSGANECLCVETFSNNCLGFHNTPNTLLHELVTQLQEMRVVEGVSSGIASVISDYTNNMPPVFNSLSLGQLRKVVRLIGDPWTDIEVCEKITIKIIAVLAGSGYKLSMPINIDADTRVYFFIRDPEEQSDCIKIPTLSKGGNSYQPMLIKSKASVYGRTNSVKNRIRASLRRKTLAKRFHSVPENDGAGADSGAAWWQQTSIDMGDADGDTNQGLK